MTNFLIAKKARKTKKIETSIIRSLSLMTLTEHMDLLMSNMEHNTTGEISFQRSAATSEALVHPCSITGKIQSRLLDVETQSP